MLKKEDSTLFRESILGTRELPSSDTVLFAKERPKTRVKTPSSPSQRYPLSDHLGDNLITPDQYIEFHRSGLQPRQWRKLKQGSFSVEATLDLHGLKTETAREQLVEFITLSQEAGFRQLLIIHGKGQRSHDRAARLKNLVYVWLPQFACVLGFCSCQPKDGGTGALYLLLKASPKES